MKNLKTYEGFFSLKKDKPVVDEPLTMTRIDDGLYKLSTGGNLKWNWFSRSWKIVSNISDDILTQDLPDVDFEEMKSKYKIKDGKITHYL